jgi:aspartyl-tRNA(Asn)/glutamyl-tRNA(Gln) amidotransferase subunit C
MAVTREDVRRVAALARLDLREDEEEALVAELNEILAYVEKLRELDLEGVEPLTHGQAGEGTLREDRVAASLTQAEALAGAPASAEGHFAVPQIVRLED